MNGDPLYSIGDLARRTGLTVKAIRFYSDEGIVPPADRSPAGYRRYDLDAVARLDLVRTLRELGVDLPTIRKVVDRELSLAEVAAAHAEALAVRIRTLRLRRAVLTAVARRGSTSEEMDLMHKLARLSEDERRRLIGDFLSATFDGLDADLGGVAGSLTPELPDDPEPEQVEAWVELAELAQDPGFRARVRGMAERLAADARRRTLPRRDPVALVRDEAGPAVAAGVDPASPRADEVVAAVTAAYARDRGLTEAAGLRAALEGADDPRWDRYLESLAVINGWPPPRPTAPAVHWFVEALRAREQGCGHSGVIGELGQSPLRGGPSGAR
ncbi:MerR family transcriptional regulator [Nonomuraea purpurea]|uniref:MerR family transcriptional regulator n=1 Tax=Nonomuraea purpurea TaxID=1849276 RepID=A0ABV8G366_9ACTN